MRRVLFLALLSLIMFLPLVVRSDTATHALPDEARKRQVWFGDALSPYIVSGCTPAVPASSLTFAAFACEGYVRDTTTNELLYVPQAAAGVGPLNAGNGTYWLALHKDRTSNIGGWTRQAGTHYLWQLTATQPAAPAGGLVMTEVTVAGGVITVATPFAYRSPVDASLKRHNVRSWGAVGDGTTDDTGAFQRATAATRRGNVLYIPRAEGNAFYRLLGAWTVTIPIAIKGDGYAFATGSGRLDGSCMRQEGAGVIALDINAGAGEMDGVIVEDICVGGTAASGSGLVLRGNVSPNGVLRSRFKNILITGAGTAAANCGFETRGLSVLNEFTNIRMTMGFTASLHGGYGIPPRGICPGSNGTGSSGPNTWIGGGVAGITTAPGIGLELNGDGGSTWIGWEFEGNTVGINFGATTIEETFIGSYSEANGTNVTGTVTSAANRSNISIASAGAGTQLNLPATIGLSILPKAGVLRMYGGIISDGAPIAPYNVAGTQYGAVYASKSNVTATYNADVEGGVPLFGHTDANLANVMLMQLAATGALADSRFHLGADSANLGDIGMRAYRRSTGVQRNVYINRAKIDVIATASLPAAGGSEDGRIIIEDAGAGDRNLIIYAGGQRFRIDGGAPF